MSCKDRKCNLSIYYLTEWLLLRATSARQDATGMDITSRCTLGDPNKLPEGVPQPARMPYISDKHPRQTLEVINLLRKHRELCDVVLVVGAKKIYAHRVILSACSPYFRYFPSLLFEGNELSRNAGGCAGCNN